MLSFSSFVSKEEKGELEKVQLDAVLKISTPLSTRMNYYIIIARKATEIINICNSEP